MADERRQDRLEREINEILSNIDHFPTPQQRRARARRQIFRQAAQRVGDAVSSGQRAIMRSMSGVSLSQLMLLSFVLILGSMFFRRVVPVAWPWMMYAGIVLFLVTFTLFFFARGSSSGPTAQQYWRGRRMTYQSQPALTIRLRQWWGRYIRR